MVQTRAQTRGQKTQPTADIVRSSHIQDTSSVEYEFGPTYSIDFVHDVGADLDDNFGNGVASVNDAASRMTQGSGGADDAGSVPPPPRGGNESPVIAPSLGVPEDNPVPPFNDLTFPDDLATGGSMIGGSPNQR